LKKVLLLLVLGIASTIPCASAPSKLVGTWQLDLSASDFGKDPAPKSITLTIFEDSTKKQGYREHRVNADGSFDYEWRGTKDGTPHAVIVAGVPQTTSLAAIKEVNGDLVEHGIESDGTLLTSRLSLSPDGHTITLVNTWIEWNGTETRQRWCFRRAK
jgi:hypothetical protein